MDKLTFIIIQGQESVWGMYILSIPLLPLSQPPLLSTSLLYAIRAILFLQHIPQNSHDALAHLRLSTMESDDHKINPLKPQIIFPSFIPTSVFVTMER